MDVCSVFYTVCPCSITKVSPSHYGLIRTLKGQSFLSYSLAISNVLIGLIEGHFIFPFFSLFFFSLKKFDLGD